MGRTTDSKDIRQLRPFLGLDSYFRIIVANFSKLVVPLMRLLQKNVAWEFGVEESNIVKEIKEILSFRPILLIFNASLETVLYIDACSIGLGAILMQGQEKSKKVVACYRRKTSAEWIKAAQLQANVI